MFTRSVRILILTCLILMPCTAQSGQHEGLAAESQHAEELIATGHPEQAIPIYEELIRAVPGNSGLLTDLGIACETAGQDQRAIQEFRAALKLKPGDTNTQLLLALAYLNLNQTRHAVVLLEEVVSARPDNEMARLKLGETFVALGRDAEAVGQFRKFCLLNPQNPKGWYELGRSYSSLSQDVFLRLRRVAPESGYFLALLATARAKQRQYGAALKLYHEAVLKLPQMRDLYAAEAAVYHVTGHLDWAAAEKQKESSLAPPDCGAQPLECDFQAGRYSDLIEQASTSTSPKSYYWEAKAYDCMAIQAYLHLARLPPSPEFYEVMAEVDIARGDFPKAVRDLQGAKRLSPLDPKITESLAIAYRQVGERRNAQQLLERLVKTEPDSSRANYLLGDTLLGLHRPRQAIPYLQKSLALNPAFPGAQRSLGNACMQAGNPRAAIPYLRAALRIDKDGAVHYQLARAYEESGEAGLAQKMIDKYGQIQARNRIVAEQPDSIPPP
jgi:predicted Zn-dependent protease